MAALRPADLGSELRTYPSEQAGKASVTAELVGEGGQSSASHSYDIK